MKRKIIAFMLATVSAVSMLCPTILADEKEQWITTTINGVDFKFDTYNGVIEKAVKASSLGGDTSPKANLKTYHVTIPNSIEGVTVKGTSKNAFCDGDDLAEVKFPSTVTFLGEYTFAGCDNITSVTIPASVTEIPRDCFSRCDNLSNITFNKNLKKIGMNAFFKCPSLTSITLPSTVTDIEGSAFAFSGLKTIVIPKTVTSISDSAFKSSELQQATVNASIKTLPVNMFADCKELKSVTLGNEITKIDFSAFLNCKSLTSVTIPDSVKNIADNAFNGCPNVTIYCSKGSFAETYAIKNGINYKAGQNVVTVVPDTITVTINGEALSLSQPPVNRNGSVLVPMRAIFEALGAEVNWYQSEKKIYAKKGVTNVYCWIDSDKAMVNGQAIKLPTKPQIVNGTTVVPARFVAETFGANVSWNAETQTVSIVVK